MHQTLGPYDVAAKMLHNTLVTEADAEYGYLPRKRLDHLERHTSIFRPARSRGNDEMRWFEAQALINIDLVIAVDHDVSPTCRKSLHQVVGKRVVVVDQ